MNNLVLDRRHSRMVDQVAIEKYGMSGLVMMENAGRRCAEEIMRTGIDGPVIICCGAGNNGGDGLVVARHLRNAGVDVCVVMSSIPDALSPDARTNFEILAKTKTPIHQKNGAEIASFAEFFGTSEERRPAWIVDALLGTGATGSVRPPLDQWITQINASKVKRCAVDLPSGLDCDTGQTANVCIRADLTCTFATFKPCFFSEPGRSLAGRVRVIDIGIPAEVLLEVGRAQSATAGIDFGQFHSENGE